MPLPAATISGEEFLAAFRLRQAFCLALLDLSAEQSALIEADAYADLVGLLGEKQRVLDALLDAGRTPIDLWRAWPNERDRLPAPLRSECERLLADSEALLKQLMDAEQSSAERLAARRNATEAALAAVHHGGIALSAYGDQQLPFGSRRLDVGL
jgi:hypothetical protein